MDRIIQVVKHVWFFPALVVGALVLLTVFQISGSSISVYDQLDGTYPTDPHVLAGNPRGVRSDEWIVNTQMTVAQAKEGYPKVNKNIGQGQNMVLMEVPSKDWSAFFRPQNMSFFVMPLTFAFAFKWWFMLASVILACYFFMLQIFPKKVLRAALFALFVGFTPMMFWWWASGMLLTLAYSFLIAGLALKLLRTDSLKARLLLSAALSYTLTCFALLFYPPFQIPCALAVLFFLVGWILEHHKTKGEYKKLIKLWPYVLGTVVITVVVGALFYESNKSVISAVTHTSYPGTRVITGGGMDPLLPFSSFLSPNLQYDEKAASGYLLNQSEASNFIFIAPFLFLPSLYIVVREKSKNHRMLWALLLINLLIAMFLARMFISWGWLEPFFKLFLLDKVPSMRLLIGLGLSGILQLALLVRALETSSFKKLELWLLGFFAGASGLIIMLSIGIYTIDHFHIFIASFAKVLLFALWISFAIFLLFQKRFVLAMMLLIGFSLMSVYRVNPLYRGLSPVTDSPIIKAIAAYPHDKAWATVDDRLIVNFPVAAGQHSISGVYFYPQFTLWDDLDTKHQYTDDYNRYAHIIFSDDPQMIEPFYLQHADTLLIQFKPCEQFLQTHVSYVLAPKALSDSPSDHSCLQLKQTVKTPARQYYIYQIIRG